MKTIVVDNDYTTAEKCAIFLKQYIPDDCDVALFVSAEPDDYSQYEMLYFVLNRDSDLTAGKSASGRMMDDTLGFMVYNTISTVITNAVIKLTKGRRINVINLVPKG